MRKNPIFNPYEPTRFGGDIPILDADIDSLGDMSFRVGRLSYLDIL